ncbi:MAG: amidase domain-containing protein, partial [Anaerolineae bacterium]
GSVRQETDAAGAVSAVREWSPYGEELGGVRTGLGFTGEWYDANVGLTYLRARWYAEKNGSFISPDSVTPNFYAPQSLNVYVYVVGNPIRFTDPSGNVPYDRNAAAQYAERYAQQPNPDYGEFGGSDCTAFVSQALLAGGFPEDEQWFWEGLGATGRSSRCSEEQCCDWWCGVERWLQRSAHCGHVWALTDEMYKYLTIDKGFESISLDGTEDATGITSEGTFPEGEKVQSPVLPWANDVTTDGQPRTETINVPGSVRAGDVVFYKQRHAAHVIDGGDFNHAAFVVGWGMQTRLAVPVSLYEPPYIQTPHIVDHSSPISDLGRRAINDTYTEVNKIVIVLIPDEIPEPKTPWLKCK